MAETGGTEIQETVEIGTEIGVEALELVHTVVRGDGVRGAVGTDERCTSLSNANVVGSCKSQK